MSNRPDDRSVASKVTEVTTFLLGIALLILVVDGLPLEVFSAESKSFFFAVGAVGIWRYSWWLIQAVRSVWYNRRIFPRLRAEADAQGEQGLPPELYVLCTSFRIEPEVSFRVYDALVREVADYGVPTTIFASLSDRTDVDIITHVMDDNGWPENIELRYMFQKGDGKRSAMAEVLRAISRRMPTPGALLVSMDGDIRLEPGTLSRSLSFFGVQEDLGALTTNNSAIVTGGDATKEWYDIRYAQRHLVMSSMSVSRRLLVLTGRYSAFRTELATQPDFIELVENDHVDHWRFGTFKFLSGDDKSTWYWLLKNGWRMLYIPDVHVSGFEELPDRRRFFTSTTDLMRRWYGNMLRTSNRAIALGPRPMGLFTWWSLVDQRLSMWTTLIGPTVALLVTLFIRPSFIFAYALWILFTRGIVTLILAWQHGRFSLLWVPLIYYNQVWGALLKTYVSFRFNRQKWSRQGISAGEPDDPAAVKRQRRMGHVLHAFAYGVLLYVLILATGVLQPPDRTSLAILTDGSPASASRVDERWLSLAIADAPEGGSVQLPAGDFRLDDGLLEALEGLDRPRAGHLLGATGGTTRLIVSSALASHLSDGRGRPIAEAAACPQPAGCTLTLTHHSIRLKGLRIRVDAGRSGDTLASAKQQSKEKAKDV
ncbi:glycosyltransferase Alg8 [Halomonas shengliensis]|uniref:Glycosyltransferase Alg8 n=1 Tax=Halomonas shengliensis TaxID=419597 RepID=A0A1H0HQF0_9GAMM|nr:glycosyltransferase [Halomonas shengliensis]SDO21343.1 glycosyltransferase Alg8 [Halomonas shengliensis]